MTTKTLSVIALATVFMTGPMPLRGEEDKTVGEKTAEVWDKTKEKTEEAADVVVEKTKAAADAVEDAIDHPDADARKVDVTVSDRAIQMSPSFPAGKTAFIVKNAGKQKHNFEIRGADLEKSFWLAIAPGDSKTMQVDLKSGSYEAVCKDTDLKMKFTVK